jgi:hypothetical protein
MMKWFAMFAHRARGMDYNTWFLADCTTMWELVTQIVRVDVHWTYIKSSQRLRDGLTLYFLSYYLEPHNDDQLADTVEEKLKIISYMSKSKMLTFNHNAHAMVD